MADNNSKVNRLDPFTGLEIPEREVKTTPPVDPFTGQQITSTRPKGMGVMVPYDLPTDRGGRQSYLDKGVNLRPFVDINEQRAQNQGKWEQYWNGLQNMRGIAVGTAVEGAVGLAEGLARWGSGGFKKDEFSDVWNTWTGGKVDEYKEYMRNKYPIYKTKEEQDAIGYESLGDWTFWTDDFMSGVGYMAGAIGGGMGAGLLLKGATAGLKYGLQAASATGKMQNVMKAMVTGTDLGTAITATGYAKQALNAGHRFAIASSMAHAEAATEARDMMQTAYSNALEAMAEAKGVEVNDLSFADKQKARETARRLSNTGYLVNLAVLGISNTIQFGRMVYPSFNQMRPKVKGLGVRGTNVTDNLARNTAAGRFAQRLAEKEGLLQGAGTELFQEGTQFLTAETVADVARRNSDTTGIEDWTRGFGEAWSKLDSKEGLASLYLGALTGGFGGGVRTARKAIGKKYRAENLQRQMAIAALENPMTFNIAARMEAGTQSEVIGQLAKESLERGDHKGFRDAQFELLMGNVMMHEQLGTIDYMLQQLEDSKNMTKEEFAKSFGIDPEVEFDPAQIVDGLKSKIDRFLTLKRAVDTMSPGRPIGTSIGNWLTKSGRQKLSEEEKQQRLEEEQYKAVLLQEAWRSQDQNRRISKLIDEINSATQGEGVTPDMMMDFLTEEEAKKAEPIKDMEELVGKKPYLSLSPEVRKKLQDRIDEIPDPIQREIIDSKRKDLERLTADRAKAIFAMEELLRSPESRMAAIQRRQAEEDAVQEQRLNKRADEIISNSLTEDDLNEFMKSDEFDEMPQSAKDKIADARNDRMHQEKAFERTFDTMSSDDLVARLVLLQDMKEKTAQQDLEQKVLEKYIPYRKNNPQSYKPVTVSPERETPLGKDTPKDKSKEKPEKIKKLAAKHTKAFKEAVDEVEKLNAAQTILNHFRMAQERGIDSFLDPDVLLEVQETINELSVQGYEIVDYTGQPYDVDMLVEANFFIDESLEPGQRVIYMVKRPEIRKDGEVVQTAQIIVKQSPLGKGDGSSKTDVQPEQPKGGRVSMRNGEFKQVAGQVQYDEAGDPIPGADSRFNEPIDRNFVKTPEGIETLEKKGVEFRMSSEYEGEGGGKFQAILVYVGGTDTAIGFLPAPEKDATSATVAELLKTQDSVKARVENFSFGGIGNFLQGAPHVQASTVIDLERDSIAAIGVVKERQLLYGATIEGREFGDLEIRRFTKGKGFLDGQVTMAIQYPNGQYGNIVFSTLEVGDHGIDVLKEYLQNPDAYAIENIRARIGVPNDFVPERSKFSLQPISSENQTGVFTLFEFGEHVIRMDNQNLLTMLSGAGRLNFKVGRMVETPGADARTNYTFEENPNVDEITNLEIGAKLLGGEYFKGLVRASKMQVDSTLLEKNPKNYTSTLGTGIKYKDYYDFLLNEVLLTDTRFIEGLPVFDVGIDFVLDEQIKPEEAISKVKLEQPSGHKKTTTTVDEGAGKLKPKFGKRPRRGAKATAELPTTPAEAKAEMEKLRAGRDYGSMSVEERRRYEKLDEIASQPEAPKKEWKVGQTVQIKYRNNNYLVTYQGLGGENKIVNQKTGKELNATSPYASKILDK